MNHELRNKLLSEAGQQIEEAADRIERTGAPILKCCELWANAAEIWLNAGNMSQAEYCANRACSMVEAELGSWEKGRALRSLANVLRRKSDITAKSLALHYATLSAEIFNNLSTEHRRQTKKSVLVIAEAMRGMNSKRARQVFEIAETLDLPEDVFTLS